MTDEKSNRLRICLVVLHAYPVIDPNAPGIYGGIETRAWTIAKGLARIPELEVTFIVRNPQLSAAAVVENVKIVPLKDFMYFTRFKVAEHVDILPRFPFLIIKRWNWLLPVWMFLLLITKPFRHHHEDQHAPNPFYQNLSTDILATFGVHSTSAQVIAASKLNGAKSLLFVGSDNELNVEISQNKNYKSEYNEKADICCYCIEQADQIIVQKPEQRVMLKEHFSREAYQYINPIDIDSWLHAAENRMPEWENYLGENGMSKCPRPFVLWIGRADNFHKRADLMLKVAKECPTIPFLLVMNPRDAVIENQLKKSRLKNLYLLEKVPHTLMPCAFKQAKLFVSTSSLRTRRISQHFFTGCNFRNKDNLTRGRPRIFRREHRRCILSWSARKSD